MCSPTHAQYLHQKKKKANNSRWILMAVLFSFVKTQCNFSLFDVLRHGWKEFIHSERNTMQPTMFNKPYPTVNGSSRNNKQVRTSSAYSELSWKRIGNHNSKLRAKTIFATFALSHKCRHCDLRVTQRIKYYLKLLLLQSVPWNLTIAGTLVVRIYSIWLYSTYHPVKHLSHCCQERSISSQHTAKKYKRRPEYYSCSHYSSQRSLLDNTQQRLAPGNNKPSLCRQQGH